MKALVTGSTGFVGGTLCRALVAQGWEVRAFRRQNSLATLLNGLPVEQVFGDLTQPDTLVEAAKGMDAIFHTAAIMNAGSDLELSKRVTVQGARNVMEAALAARVKRLVHVSSVAALGVPSFPPRGSSPMVMDETHTWNERPERWTYGYAKYLAEMEVQRAVAMGLDAVTVNPSVILGAGDLNRVSDSVVQIVGNGHLAFSVDGGLNLIHVEDIASGILAAYERGRTGERYILSNVNATITSFLKTVAKVTQKEPPRIILPGGVIRALRSVYPLVGRFINLPADADLLYQAGHFFYYSNQKARSQLGWEPVRTIESAIKEAYDWFQMPLAVPNPTKGIEDGLQTDR